MNLREVGDSLFCYQLKEIVDKCPYFSFVTLSALLEFMGNCYRKGQGSKDCTREVFFNLINKIDALKAYRLLNFKNDKNEDNNYLYKYLRCGMLHEVLPKEDVVLCPDRNDLSDEKKIIGAKNLYEDMKRAWSELKSSPEISSYMERTEVLRGVDDYSGSTTSSILVNKDLSQKSDFGKSLEDELIAAEGI